MSEIKSDLLYTKEHEWVRKAAGGTVVIGITDFAQSSLGDVTFLDIPDAGKELRAGEIFGTVESVKSVSDLYAPVSGKVVKSNRALVDDPAGINQDPYGDGWMLEIQVSNSAELEKLLSAGQYESVAE
ncbi:MAG TPA: glycine cleavage system protein GcvH [Bdellovibrionota bacterium]|jgi:glycine cleavage system H protein|nr:glycine cleavage system protein GcvH [Bdellovibrionota bacterium]